MSDDVSSAFTPDEDQDEELPPLSALVDMLTDAVQLLEGVDDLVVAHRRAAGDDHPQLERFRHVSERLGQAWAATVSARKALRSWE
jgi:hypothetical protein